jgi:hypothetical protein
MQGGYDAHHAFVKASCPLDLLGIRQKLLEFKDNCPLYILLQSLCTMLAQDKLFCLLVVPVPQKAAILELVPLWRE